MVSSLRSASGAVAMHVIILMLISSHALNIAYCADIRNSQTLLEDHIDNHIVNQRALFSANSNNTSFSRAVRDGRTPKREDRYLNTSQLLTKYGHPVREHHVITTDGYNLTLIHIPGDGPPVFLMHGLLGSSDDFVVSGPDKALAYKLANASYDVWLGNARGNKYSRRHVRLDPNKSTFWEFSWHEIGICDVPNMIDFALRESQQSQLTYIGHGQGTTVFFVLTSIFPDYNEKIKLMVSLGTTAYVWHVKSPVLRSLIPFRDQFPVLFRLGYYELLPATKYTQFLARVCSSSRLSLRACVSALFEVFGFDYDQIDYVNLPVQLSHFPSGSSLRQLTHYLQLAASRRFAQYDFGKQQNLKIYESEEPPSYPVGNITAPVIAFYGLNDYLSSYDDAEILLDQMPNVIAFDRVPHTKFAHFDFIWAKDIEQLLYRKLLGIINETVSADNDDGTVIGNEE